MRRTSRFALLSAVVAMVASCFAAQSEMAPVATAAGGATGTATIATDSTSTETEKSERAGKRDAAAAVANATPLADPSAGADEGQVATKRPMKPLDVPAEPKPEPQAPPMTVSTPMPVAPSSTSPLSGALSNLGAGDVALNRARVADGKKGGGSVAGPVPGRFEALQMAKEAAKQRASESTKAKSEEKRAYDKTIAHAMPTSSPPPPPPAQPLADRKNAKDGDDNDAESTSATFDEGGTFISAGTNPLVDPKVDALSTFAIDVDTGSYTLSKRFLENGAMPNAHGVRVEEWVNAFHYSYPDESGAHPFSIHMEGAPLAKRSYVMRVGIQGKRIAKAARAPVHLTFLVDVSGSMSGPDRLPLAKESMKLLLGELDQRDSVGIVTYAGDTRVVLETTTVTNGNRAKIARAIDGLRNGGGTNMGSGMELAYREAGKALGDKGISRVIVLSDGDANIGRVSYAEMLKAIKGYVSEGVTMSTVGFGTGNYRDNTMEQLADAGNGNYSYVGNIKDARKVFVDDLTGTLQVIAKDVKIQVEMNPAVVESYRLIGYENRDVADKDFRNDKVDAGEIGAGHAVTALYEVNLISEDSADDVATVRVRYKQPRGERATEVSEAFPSKAFVHDVASMSVDGQFATGVALTAEVFRHSEHMQRLGIDLGDAQKLLLSGAKGPFAEERKELARLIAPLAAGAAVAKR